MAEQKDYKYYAFISYSHKDKKWANWLYRKLCSYRLPRIVKKSDKNLPNKLTPLFLDEYHLQAGKIKDNINKELDSAKNLIVICSPNITVANPDGINWIDYEVEYFANSGKANNIIPVMVDGDKSISFSPTLKRLDVLAQDVSKLSKDRIISNVVAGLLGLDPDVLWRDERRRLIRRRIINSCLAVLCLVALSLAGLLYWDLTRTHVEYFAESSNMFGVDVGKSPISAGELNSLPMAYRFEYKGYRWLSNDLYEKLPSELRGSRKGIEWMPRNVFRRLKSVVCVDSFDRPKFYPNRRRSDYLQSRDLDFQRRDYKYDESGVLLVIGQKNAENVVRSVCKYERGDLNRSELLCFDENGINTIGNAYRMFEEYSPTGKIANEIMLNQNGSKRIKSYDEHENCIRVEYVAPNGLLGVDAGGVAIIKSRYDECNRELSREYYNTSTNRIINTIENNSGYTNQYDVTGRKMVQIFVDDKNRPCPNGNNDGLVKSEVVLNEDMLCESIRFYGASNVFLKGFAYKYDRIDRKVADTNINECLEPIEVGGVAYTTIKYDDLIDGKKEEYRFYDIKNVPCISSQGCVGYVKEFDKFGNEIKIVCIDENGSCTNNAMGWAIRNTEFDSQRRLKRQYFLNQQGLPFAYEDKEIALLTKKKIIDLRVSYNGNLCFGDTILEGTDKKLRVIRQSQGLLLGVMWMNMNEIPVAGEQGWTLQKLNYNNKGEMDCCVWTDEKGRLKGILPSGIAMMRCTYVHQLDGGVSVVIQYFNEDQYLIDCGMASTMYLEYDKDLRLKEFYCKNKVGLPIALGDFGAEKIRFEYDGEKRLSKVYFFMQNGEAYEAWDKKIVRVQMIYAEDGNIQRLIGYDKNGKEMQVEYTDEMSGCIKYLEKFVNLLRYRKNYNELVNEYQNVESEFNIEYNGIVVRGLIGGGQAESVGMKTGDILDEMKGWRVSEFAAVAKTNSVLATKNFSSIIYGLTNTVRTLKVYRKMSNQKWKRLEFQFNPGLFGCYFGPIKLSDEDFQEMIRSK